MQFLHGASKSQMVNAFTQSFNDNTPDAMKTMKPTSTGFWARSIPLTRTPVGPHACPAHGYHRGHQWQGQVDHCRFGLQPCDLSVWLGPKPPTANVKKGCSGSRAIAAKTKLPSAHINRQKPEP